MNFQQVVPPDIFLLHSIATGKGWLLHCGDAASPVHPYCDIHGLDKSMHTISFLPDWLARFIIGRNAPRLRKLIKEHGDEVEAISAHDIYSFREFSVRIIER